MSPLKNIGIYIAMFCRHMTMDAVNQSTKSYEISISIQKSCDVPLIVRRCAEGATFTSHLHVVYLCVSCATRHCSDLVTGNTWIKKA